MEQLLIEWLNKGYYPVNIDKGTTAIFVDTDARTTYLVVNKDRYYEILDTEHIDEILEDEEDKYLSRFYDWMTGYWNTYSYEEFVDSVIEFRKSEYFEENVEYIKQCLSKKDWKSLNFFIELAMNENLTMPITRITK